LKDLVTVAIFVSNTLYSRFVRLLECLPALGRPSSLG